jgi:hypothetical protein
MSHERDEAMRMQEATEAMIRMRQPRQEKPEQTPREMIAKLAAMSPEEFNRFMAWNFNRICKLPLSAPDKESL